MDMTPAPSSHIWRTADRERCVRCISRWAAIIIALAGYVTCEPCPAVAQNANNVAVNVQSVRDALDVLKNATGRYCPSLFCGFAGYDISAINLADNGQTLVIIHDDGARGDTLPVHSLNPRDLGLGVLGFTDDFEPQLVTTHVEVHRLIAAIDMIKQAPPLAFAPGAAPTPTPSVPSGPIAAVTPTSPPAAPIEMPAPARVVKPAPVPRTAIAANMPTSSGYGGKRLAIKMLQNCPADPDPLGVLPGNDSYSDCAQEELDKVRGWITSSLTSKGVFAEIGEENPDFILTVTLTQSMVTEGAAGFITDLAPATLEFTATYQLTDSRGQVVKSDTVHHEDAEDYFGGNEDNVEQQFADKIAASVTGSAPGSAAAPPGASNAPASEPSP